MSEYPDNDNQFEEVSIAEVNPETQGWSIKRADGWSFFVPPESPIEPKPGMIARFYGDGIGYAVRGLFLDGMKVYYRTGTEEKEHSEIQMYGANAADWLKRWDEGKPVWSIEMGGLGPGYEQAIQITTAETLRHLIAENYRADRWDDPEIWKEDREQIEQSSFKNPVIEKLGGISGAMWGAALSLAIQFYRRGPREILTDTRLEDRKIQVSRTFPGVA